MAHYIDADKLISEIERKRDSALERQKNLEKIGQETVLNEMIATELNRLISFVTSLQQEQPEVDLEKAADKYSNENEYMEVGFCDEPIYIGHKTEKAFIAGAEWQAERLLKGSPMPEDTVIFQKGIEEGKRLTMEDAVEGVVCYGSKGAYIETDFLGEYDTDVYGNPGDKVRIIIVKEDEK